MRSARCREEPENPAKLRLLTNTRKGISGDG